MAHHTQKGTLPIVALIRTPGKSLPQFWGRPWCGCLCLWASSLSSSPTAPLHEGSRSSALSCSAGEGNVSDAAMWAGSHPSHPWVLLHSSHHKIWLFYLCFYLVPVFSFGKFIKCMGVKRQVCLLQGECGWYISTLRIVCWMNTFVFFLNHWQLSRCLSPEGPDSLSNEQLKLRVGDYLFKSLFIDKQDSLLYYHVKKNQNALL